MFIGAIGKAEGVLSAAPGKVGVGAEAAGKGCWTCGGGGSSYHGSTWGLGELGLQGENRAGRSCWGLVVWEQQGSMLACPSHGCGGLRSTG